MTEKPSAEEIASFRFAGTRARPRKGIEAVFRTSEVRLVRSLCSLPLPLAPTL